MPPASLQMLASPPSTIHDGFATIRRPRIGPPRKPPRPPSLASVPEDTRTYDRINSDFNSVNSFSYATLARNGNFKQECDSVEDFKQFKQKISGLNGLKRGSTNGINGNEASSPTSPIGNPNIPWWDLATRKSKYRSCPQLDMQTVSIYFISMNRLCESSKI